MNFNKMTLRGKLTVAFGLLVLLVLLGVRLISAATDEQSKGIEQVNRAVGQMDSITQQNAALVEEAAAASRLLEDQGRQLIAAVTIFRLDDTPLPIGQYLDWPRAAPAARP